MPEWRIEWEGETVWVNTAGEVIAAVRPAPNRAVIFDSRILHAGHAPSRVCGALRVTLRGRTPECMMCLGNSNCWSPNGAEAETVGPPYRDAELNPIC
jgi:hypothetical protein